MKEDYIRTKYDQDYTDTIRAIYTKIVNRFGSLARITNFLDLVKFSYDIKEWALFDATRWQRGDFTSYLIGVCQSFFNGEPVNFSQLYRDICSIGEFTVIEKKMMADNNIEETMRAIFLAIMDPSIKTLIINNN